MFYRILPLFLALSACSSVVEYGKIPHMALAAGADCNPAEVNSDAFADKPYFAVTSRLPDCSKPGAVGLTSHRADRLRYYRYDRPAPKAKSVSFAFQPEEDWWQSLQSAAQKGNGRILVILHGYRETPFTASRDAAQMGRLSVFEGPVIQYSWPSQGKLLSYQVDQNNLEFSADNFSAFLVQLAQKPWAKDIVIVSHSMGIRLALPAVEAVDRAIAIERNPIRTLIFASPDMDRQYFENEAAKGILSPQHLRAGRHVTIYASDADAAMAVSQGVNGYPRLGSLHCFDPAEAKALKAAGKPERCYVRRFTDGGRDGVIVVDLSDLRHRGTGHSDFLLTGPGCLDFAGAIAGKKDGAGARQATDYRHVFTLPRQTNEEAKRDAEICMRD
jgi:esterase/lipase superfamily enzyme